MKVKIKDFFLRDLNMTGIDYLEKWLTEEGFRSNKNSYGELFFKYEGVPIVCLFDGDNKVYIRLVLPNLYEIKDDRIKVLEIINLINSERKFVKAYIEKNNKVWLSIDMPLPNIDHYIESSYIEHCLDALLHCRRILTEEIFRE